MPITSLSNAILLVVLARDPEVVPLDDIFAGVAPEFRATDAIHAVMDLESAGLLEDSGVHGSSITEKGKEHLSSLIAAHVLGNEGEDLGDVSTHLLRNIPSLDYVFPGDWRKWAH